MPSPSPRRSRTSLFVWRSPIDWVIGLPINAKPNVILFTTGQYSVLDQLKYGFVMTTVGVILLVIAGMTWFRVLGITP
ncbi:MAG: anion permease [Vicinamibacterales bacterium]